MIGRKTRAAMQGELKARASEPEPPALGIDVLDEQAVRRFQAAFGLEEDGLVGSQAQAALRLEHQRTLGADPAVPGSIRRFQREHDLPQTGIIDEATQGAMRAIRSAEEPSTPEDHERAEGWFEQENGQPRWMLDPADPESVKRFQREHGLVEDGIIGPQTQVAIRAVRAEHARGRTEPDGDQVVSRPYPHRTLASGLFSSTALPVTDPSLSGEIAAIVEALNEDGRVSRAELAERVGARFWGPGRFRRALDVAEREDRIRKAGDRYVLRR